MELDFFCFSIFVGSTLLRANVYSSVFLRSIIYCCLRHSNINPTKCLEKSSNQSHVSSLLSLMYKIVIDINRK